MAVNSLLGVKNHILAFTKATNDTKQPLLKRESEEMKIPTKIRSGIYKIKRRFTRLKLGGV